MQDRFKFRFFDKKKQKMMYENSNFSDYCKDEWWGYEEQMALDALDLFDNPKHYILMQCTGLKDKNGKLIYEGDIVRDKCSEAVATIEYLPYTFSLMAHIRRMDDYLPLEDICYALETATPFEVIGNIYENPELLEVSDDD